MTRPSSTQVQGILETCINVSDMSRAREFYQSIFGFEVMTSDERFCAFRVGQDVLLLFTEGESKQPVQLEGGIIPPHETLGAGHFASPSPQTRLKNGGYSSVSEESKSSPRFDGSGEEPARANKNAGTASLFMQSVSILK